MNQLKIAFSLVLVAGCSSPEERPSPNPPPPWGVAITGGTMTITRDGKYAVVADPDRDRLLAIDLATDTVAAELALAAGDEPGRVLEDGAGRVHVALRGGGELLTLATPIARAPLRRAACPEPRGLAWDPATDLVHLACAGGELVSFAAESGDAVRRLRFDRDLRDVTVAGAQLLVTRFRTAEVLTLDAAGAIVSRALPPTVQRTVIAGDDPTTGAPGVPEVVDAVAAVAWRTIALADGRVLVSHQRQVQGQLSPKPGGYGDGCGEGPVEAAVSVGLPGQPMQSVTSLASGALPVDVAVSPAGDRLAFAVAGSQTIQFAPTSALATPDGDDEGGCKRPESAAPPIHDQLGTPTSLAYTPGGALVVFYPEVPALVVHQGDSARTIALPGELGYDAGRALFHAQTQSGLACASCHPEGRDDGLVWDFAEIGVRRTQSLAGHILARAPYHWNGDMKDLSQLMDDVFAKRMLGGIPSRSERLSLGPWLDTLPTPRPSPTADAATIARGQALFDSAELACASCHNGAALTNNMLVNVGTGSTLKVPSLLGVSARAPYMHDGCAATLRDRFGACGGGDLHGKTSLLTEPELADLVAYLESL